MSYTIRNKGFIQRKRQAKLEKQKNKVLFELHVVFSLGSGKKQDERKMSRLVSIQGLPTQEKLEAIQITLTEVIANESGHDATQVRITIVDYKVK